MQSSDIFAELPKYNCSACGFPSCSTFSRRIAFSKNKPEECPFLKDENLTKIKRLLMEEVEIEPRKKATAFIQPCTEEGHVTAETNLCSYSNFGNGFDAEMLCLILENSEYEKVNCSSELGYAVLYKDTKRIHIFKNGNIVIRKAKDDNDVYSEMNYLVNVLLPSTICDCQCSFIECYFNKNCDDETENIPEILGSRSKEQIISGFEKDKINFSETEKIISILKNIRKKEFKDRENDLKNIEEILKNELKNSIRLFAEKKKSGLVLFAVYYIIRNVLNVIENLKNENNFYDDCIEIFFNCFDALKNANSKKAEESINECNKAIIKIKGNWELLCIVNSGKYLTKLI